MNKPLWSVIGFVLFAIGVLSVILSMVGLKFTFMGFIYNHGIITTIIQLSMLFGGMIILYVARTAEEEDDDI
jgi:hypothetical protein